jgi:hypothetical protein
MRAFPRVHLKTPSFVLCSIVAAEYVIAGLGNSGEIGRRN